MERVVCQISGSCHRHYLQHLCYLSSIQMWLDVLITNVLFISVFQHSAEIQVQFNYLNYFVGAFFTGFSADVKHKTHHIT